MIYGVPLTPDLEEIIGEWNQWLRVEKNVSVHTLKNYHIDLRHFLEYLNNHLEKEISTTDLSDILSRDFRGFLAYRARFGISNRSNARSFSTVRNFFRFLHKRYGIENSNLSSVRSPKISSNLPRPLSESQALQVVTPDTKNISWVYKRDIALFCILYGCGLRISEALSLTLKDVTQSPEHIIITGKGAKQRIVPLIEEVLKKIEDYRKSCPFREEPARALFLGEKGKILRAAIAQKSMRALKILLNLPKNATPHSLRHSYATHLLANGGSLRTIQELLGHSSLSTTQKYTQVDITHLKDVYSKSHPRARRK